MRRKKHYRYNIVLFLQIIGGVSYIQTTLIWAETAFSTQSVRRSVYVVAVRPQIKGYEIKAILWLSLAIDQLQGLDYFSTYQYNMVTERCVSVQWTVIIKLFISTWIESCPTKIFNSLFYVSIHKLAVWMMQRMTIFYREKLQHFEHSCDFLRKKEFISSVEFCWLALGGSQFWGIGTLV